jgi:hypothetical protein
MQYNKNVNSTKQLSLYFISASLFIFEKKYIYILWVWGMHKWDLHKLQKQQRNVVTVQLGAHLLYDRPQNENWSFPRHPA